MKSTLATLFTGAALALSLTGCALSPQQIEVKPTAEVQPANRGNNQPVQVIAVDSRDRKEFGSRGGVYKDTSLVQPANDLRPAIAETVRQGLQTLGYNAFNPGDDATTLEVRLKNWSTSPKKGRWSTK